MSAGLKILSVVSELYPLVKTGGLADVAGALPAALREHGVEVVTLVPGYPSVMAGLRAGDEVLAIPDCFGGAARVIAARAAELDLLVLDAPHLFDRPGTPYGPPEGGDWPDNAFRFGALAWIAARIGLGEISAFVPDVLHAHDWQAALAMAYLAYDGRVRPATVLTVHNLAYQGQFPKELLSALRLPARAYGIDGVEFYGAIGFLKAGLQFADHITTVSPTYAAEIQTPTLGCGIDALLRARADAGALSGILNGIDVTVWDPATDPRIPARYDRADTRARQVNKAELQKRCGLDEEPGRLLFGLVGRFAWQKGLDLLAEALPALREKGAALALLGRGEHAIEQRFVSIAREHPGRIACMIGYDEDFAHLMQAGADALIVPSRFEPCGLTQLCALRYGTVPVVASVGGLVDTVIDLDEAPGGPVATGIRFAPVTSAALAGALRRTAALWRDQAAWARVQANGMAVDVSWSQSAARYAALYRALREAKK